MRISRSILFALVPFAAVAQSAPLTEAEAVRLALGREEVIDLSHAAREEAEANVLGAGTWANPIVSYERERTDGAEGSTEQTWRISQEIDLSGRRGLRESAARRRVESVVADSHRRQDDLAAEVRRAFHETLLKQARVGATERWIARFREIESAVGRLRSGGEASGYDHRRIARELASAEARLAVENAELERVRQRLGALVPQERAAAPLSGELVPPPPPALGDVLAALPGRADLRALAQKAEAADLDTQAAGRGAMPDVTLGLGTKTVESAFGRDTGAIFSVSVPLPIFQRDQAGERRALAQARGARAEYALALARGQGDLRGLHREVTGLIDAARVYRAKAASASAALLGIAEASYRGGESSLLELLDAHRGALESEATALDLEWKARDARITFDLVAGSPR
jgi:cobalt-zinc-cadmium efflux system outer membrane protein